MPASRWWKCAGKRVFDLLSTAVLVVLAAPALAVCAMLIWAIDGRPILFRQTRVGRDTRHFAILKLRTMRPGAGALLTVAGDPRITRVGRLLRDRKMDELPQLWNVLRGEMSLVGPRPEIPAFVAQARDYRAIADLRPGLTDWASVVFHDEEAILAAHAAEPRFYQERLLPRKLALARLYRRRMSWALDLAILAATICHVFGLRAPVARLVGPDLMRRAREGL